MKRFAVGVTLAAALLVGGVTAGDIKSGPQEGKSVGVFNPLHVTGKTAGQKQCLV